MEDDRWTKKQLREQLSVLHKRVEDLEKKTGKLQAMEKILHEGEERFKAVYRCIPVPTITWQKKGRDFILIDYNIACHEFSGGLLKNFMGHQASLLYSDRPDILSNLTRCLKEKSILKWETPYRMFTKGEHRVIAFTFAFVPPDLVLSHMEDITQRKEAEENILRSEKQLRALSARLLVAAENERKRIALELHDSIGQYLTAIKVNAENAIHLLQEHEQMRAAAMLEAGIPIIKQAMDEIRVIMMDLRPTILDDLGILATLSWVCRESQSVHEHIRFGKDLRLREGDIPEPLKIVIYRIVQESLNNAVKHSGCDQVRIGLRKTKQQIILSVSDNGIGFDPDRVSGMEEKRVGLIGMRERTELSGGILIIRSRPAAGTEIKASWPR